MGRAVGFLECRTGSWPSYITSQSVRNLFSFQVLALPHTSLLTACCSQLWFAAGRLACWAAFTWPVFPRRRWLITPSVFAVGFQGGPKRVQDGPKSAPRGLKTAPRALEDASRRLQERSRGLKTASRSLQEASRRPQERSKSPREAPIALQDVSRRPQERSKRLRGSSKPHLAYAKRLGSKCAFKIAFEEAVRKSARRSCSIPLNSDQQASGQPAPCI